MNEDVLKGKWKEIKGSIKKEWGKLTDDEIAQSEGNQEKLVGVLQKNYGYSREKAEEEYKRFMSRHEEQPRMRR